MNKLTELSEKAIEERKNQYAKHVDSIDNWLLNGRERLVASGGFEYSIFGDSTGQTSIGDNY